MKFKSYEKSYEVDVWEVKCFVLKIASHYQMTGLEKVILVSRDFRDMKDWINQNELYQKRVFMMLKKMMDHESDPLKCEQHLIYMKILLDFDYPLYKAYRERLIESLELMANHYLTSDIYCLLRHLYPRQKSYRRQIIKKLMNEVDETQRYFLCEIYLIEEDYQMAYTYLKHCRYEGVLKDYDFELKSYHSLKYRLYAKKEPLFNSKWQGDMLWKKQLRF